jgi:hypothetical protein
MQIDMLMPFVGDYAVVRVIDERKNKYGLINRMGEFVVQPIYDLLDYNGDKYVCANRGYREGRKCQCQGKWGVLNLRGEIVVPFKYSYMQRWEDETHFVTCYFTVCYRKRWGVINFKNEIIMPFMPLDFLGVSNCKGWIYASVGTKSGYLDISGRQVIKIIYDDISIIDSNNPDEWFAVKLGHEYFYIDQTGKRVLF